MPRLRIKLTAFLVRPLRLALQAEHRAAAPGKIDFAARSLTKSGDALVRLEEQLGLPTTRRWW